MGRHGLTFSRVPTHSAVTVVFHAVCAPCMALVMVSRNWPWCSHGSGFRLL